MSSPGGSSKLSEQQQRRITDNFRAAKAKLAKKRPHPLSPSTPFPQRPLVSRTSENDAPMALLCRERCPTSPNFRC